MMFYSFRHQPPARPKQHALAAFRAAEGGKRQRLGSRSQVHHRAGWQEVQGYFGLAAGAGFCDFEIIHKPNPFRDQDCLLSLQQHVDMQKLIG